MSKVVQGVYLLLGANLGNPPETFQRAIQLLNSSITISRKSSLFITAPWKMESENWFYNQVLEVETELYPDGLLRLILDVEGDLGRLRKGGQGYEDRLIDIDILLFGSQVYQGADLQVPHKFLHQRAFALMPLLELQPKCLEPGTDIPYENYLERLDEERQKIKKLEGY
ncbi:2-amino-4-hydroxy-6-hydroxymethyldihydropteridine diphosphokinase [Croceimicrobium hydrocarbonivorans]|uniref:2-amino-4-hydroxy-6-hydroxymethyldihydropteridine pyrophosphokinase n=1 Tax=Croceimicrobium hydrocarbonivorans TaxID=2761580 RepID=A0A7H0VBI1_9FLAO|nr:2-amino-4-hydroxy-6-hydroxymethyldihydropteridine diphosphokinase [Croceimicrobium hydrocarbonivorans]QNR23079.1 2-amino-4-hydroxy-6-hydroxymethyldihydropteridine diphosphokinase [Croceimicrobium hydrocarbonivorans]